MPDKKDVKDGPDAAVKSTPASKSIPKPEPPIFREPVPTKVAPPEDKPDPTELHAKLSGRLDPPVPDPAPKVVVHSPRVAPTFPAPPADGGHWSEAEHDVAVAVYEAALAAGDPDAGRMRTILGMNRHPLKSLHSGTRFGVKLLVPEEKIHRGSS